MLHFFWSCFCHRNSSKTVANKATPSVCTQMGICCVNPGKHIDILKYAWQKEFITSRCDLPFGSGASCRLPRSLKGQRRAHRRHVFVHGEPKTLKVAWNRYVAATYRIWTRQVLNFSISARKLSSVHNFSQNGCQANPYYCTGQRQRFQKPQVHPQIHFTMFSTMWRSLENEKSFLFFLGGRGTFNFRKKCFLCSYLLHVMLPLGNEPLTKVDCSFPSQIHCVVHSLLSHHLTAVLFCTFHPWDLRFLGELSDLKPLILSQCRLKSNLKNHKK